MNICNKCGKIIHFLKLCRISTVCLCSHLCTLCVGGNAWAPRMSSSASVSFEALGGRSNGDLDDADFLNKRSAMSSPGSFMYIKFNCKD